MQAFQRKLWSSQVWRNLEEWKQVYFGKGYTWNNAVVKVLPGGLAICYLKFANEIDKLLLKNIKIGFRD